MIHSRFERSRPAAAFVAVGIHAAALLAVFAASTQPGQLGPDGRTITTILLGDPTVDTAPPETRITFVDSIADDLQPIALEIAPEPVPAAATMAGEPVYDPYAGAAPAFAATAMVGQLSGADLWAVTASKAARERALTVAAARPVHAEVHASPGGGFDEVRIAESSGAAAFDAFVLASLDARPDLVPPGLVAVPMWLALPPVSPG